jgi:hypothetical protein
MAVASASGSIMSAVLRLSIAALGVSRLDEAVELRGSNANAAAGELPQIALDDALRICLVFRDGRSGALRASGRALAGSFALEAGGVTIEAQRRTPKTPCR